MVHYGTRGINCNLSPGKPSSDTEHVLSLAITDGGCSDIVSIPLLKELLPARFGVLPYQVLELREI